MMLQKGKNAFSAGTRPCEVYGCVYNQEERCVYEVCEEEYKFSDHRACDVHDTDLVDTISQITIGAYTFKLIDDLGGNMMYRIYHVNRQVVGTLMITCKYTMRDQTIFYNGMLRFSGVDDPKNGINITGNTEFDIISKTVKYWLRAK